MRQTVRPESVLTKAFLLFVLVNFLVAWLNPSLENLVLFRDYRRFPKLWKPFVYLPEKEVNSSGFMPVLVDNLDLLFASHVISSVPKSDDEYRVVLLGDSSVWGISLFSHETMEAVLNRMYLHTCSGKRIVVYNLGYEFGSIPKDIIILSEAVKHDPDLVIWFFSLVGFSPRRQNVGFVYENNRKLQDVGNAETPVFVSPITGSALESFWNRTLVGRRREFSFVIRLNLSRLILLMLDTDSPDLSEPRPRSIGNYSSDDPQFWGTLPPAPVKSYARFGTLELVNQISDNVRIVYVNEPIGVGKNIGVRYNQYYPRWAYDQYRDAIREIAIENDWNYIDLWDFLLPTEFSDTPFHHTPEGEKRLAAKIAQVILSQSCLVP